MPYPRGNHRDTRRATRARPRHRAGRTDRVVPVRRDVALIVRRYLASTGRPLGATGPLFLSRDPAHRRDNQRLSPRAVGFLLAELLDRANIEGKRISPHSCRHTYAIRALRSGASTVTVQKLLGHASAVTTQRYLDHLETSELRSAVPVPPLPPAPPASRSS
jgi:integrase/recombinase XerD